MKLRWYLLLLLVCLSVGVGMILPIFDKKSILDQLLSSDTIVIEGVGAPPEDWWDTDYDYYQQMTVTNEDGANAVDTNYSVNFTFDTASLVTAGKLQADGDDLRIVYWDGSNNWELDRINTSAWNDAATRIWFNLNASIAASGTDNNYYMYYGNAGAAGPANDEEDVYLYFEDFESYADGAYPDDWSAEYGAGGTWEVDDDDGMAQSGTKSFRCNGACGGGESKVYMNLSASDTWSDYLVSAYMSRPNEAGSYFDAVMYYVDHDDPENYYMSGFETGDNSGSYEHNGGYTSKNDYATTHDVNTFYQHEVRIVGTDFNQYYEGSYKDDFTDASYTEGSIGFRNDCPAAGSYYYDDILVRHYLPDEPTISFGSETSRSLETEVDTISPYNTSTNPLTITATSTGADPGNVTLLYRYSSDNVTWGTQNGTAIYGNQAAPDNHGSIEDYQSGLWIRIANGTGVMDNITVQLKVLDGKSYSGNVSCAVYYHDGGAHPHAGNMTSNGQAEEKWINQTASGSDEVWWETFNLTNCYVDNNTQYYISASAEEGGELMVTMLSVAGTGYSCYEDLNPGTSYIYPFQDPWAGESGSTFNRSIYCSYTPNATGVGWMEWSDANNPDTASPWSWAFNFPNGTGYYEFYSIGNASGYENETPPGSADARCNYTSSVDTEDPSINLTFAGNPGGWGGPYYIPETDTAAGHGFITNDSRQNENWINITATITDDIAVDTVYLQWLNETSWWNQTHQFTNTDGNNYAINTSDYFTNISEGYNYSFAIWANDTSNNITIYNFTKRDQNNNTGQRIYYGLNYTESTINYTAFYLHDATYTDTGPAYGPTPSPYDADILHHDQGPDGTTTDTGYLLDITPVDAVEERSCDRYIGYWFDESICIPDIDIYNALVHIWVYHDDLDTETIDLAIGKTRDAIYRTDGWIDHIDVAGSDNISRIAYDGDTYYLFNEVVNITDTNASDNSIYEFFMEVDCTDTDHIRMIHNNSFKAYVIFNVPGNATLNSTYPDSDGDGLSDWDEIWNGTHPQFSDTDADGINDYWELQAGSDPNNYTETFNVSGVWQNIFTGYVTGGNVSQHQNIFTGYVTGGNATLLWQNIFNGFVTGGNATVLWQQIFSGYVTGGNSSSHQNIFSGYVTGGNSTQHNQVFTGYVTGGNATVTHQEVFSGYVTGGNDTVSWQQIFSGYVTGGNVSQHQNIFSGYVTGGNATVVWQEIFSGYVTGGNVSQYFNIFTGYVTGGNVTRYNQIFSGYVTGGNITEGVWNNIFTGYVTGGNITQPQNIFDGYVTGGNDTVLYQNIFTGYVTGGNQTATNTVFTGYITGGNITTGNTVFTGYVTGGNDTTTWDTIFSGYVTGGNVTVLWQQIFSGYVTGGNISANITQIFTGYVTGGNITIAAINITNPYPANQSYLQGTQPTIYFTLNHTTGITMNYSLFYGNSSLNTTILFTNVTGVNNGTHHYVNYFTATTYGTSYWWRVWANASDDSVNRTFIFTPVRAGGQTYGGNTLWVVALVFSLIMPVALMIVYKKRRKN